MPTAPNSASMERSQELFDYLYEKRKEDLWPDPIVSTLANKGVPQHEAEAFEMDLRSNPEKYCPPIALTISSFYRESDISAIEECFAYICTGAYPAPEFSFQGGTYQLEWANEHWQAFIEECGTQKHLLYLIFRLWMVLAGRCRACRDLRCTEGYMGELLCFEGGDGIKNQSSSYGIELLSIKY
jgi:hypothetical protein